MKKSYLLAAYLLVSSFSIPAQVSPPPAIEWQKSLGGTSFELPCINQTTDGGYIVAQSFDTVYDGSQTYDVLLIKLNSAGAIQWQKTIGTGTAQQFIAAIKQVTGGGYIMAGTSNNDYWITRLDDTGTILWEKFFGGSADEAAYDIQETSDEGYIVTGHARSNDMDVTGNHGGTDYWVVKIDASGNLEWQKALGGSDDEVSYDVGQTTDGSYIVSGSTYSYDGDVTGNHPGLGDGWIVKLNSSGILQWQKCVGGSSSDVILGMETTTDGGCIAVSPSSSFDGDVTGHHGSLDYWIVKLNSAGTIEWQKCFGSIYAENCASVDQTSDGGYIIAGGAQVNSGEVTGHHGGGSDYWIVKLNNSGDLQWQKSLGGTASDFAFAIEQTTDKGYIIAGNSVSSDGDVAGKQGAMDLWVVKLEPDALLLPVTLINFSGEVQAKQNVLHWATVTEQNNTGFEVQRSSDGIDFNTIGFIKTKSMNGNSNVKLNYDFTDINRFANTNYYKLKQIDENGKYIYSIIIVLNNNNAGQGSFAAYPNPAKSILNVKTFSAGNSVITLRVTDLSGKLLINKAINIGNGESIVPLNVSHLQAGNYFLKILPANGKEPIVKKFVIQ